MELTDIIALIIETALIPILAWGVAKLTSHLDKKIENETAEKYVNFAVDAVYTAVQQTMQTYVSALKKSGEWNEETAEIAFNNAKALALVTMGAKAQEVIAELAGDLDAWLDAKIEACTLEIKGE
jgi:predicted RecB family endonuclease